MTSQLPTGDPAPLRTALQAGGPEAVKRAVAGLEGVEPRDVVAALARAGQTVATAESLTGGLLVASLVDVPGASVVVRGGIVAYHGDLKAALVGVDPAVLARGGAVQWEVAAQLAEGARERCGATWGVGTTGVAGPDCADGQPVGTVFVGVAGPDGTVATRLLLLGDRAGIRRDTVRAALSLLASRLSAA